jgi:RNA recognition motif-containing protein
MENRLKKEIKVEETKIEDYELDEERREVLYPNVYKVEIVKQIYEDSNGVETIMTVERQHKKIGVREQVKRMVDKNDKRKVNESERIIYMEEPRRNEVEIGGYKPIYIPSFEKYENIINKKDEKMEIYEIDKNKIEEIKEPEGYLPPEVKTGENTSIVVKEVPNYLGINEVKRKLRELFEPYGMITNINVLTRFNETLNTNMPIGIAFIDFCNREDVNKLIESSQKFRISNSILKLELAKGNRN